MITVIGSINLDLIAVMSRLPKPGETVPGKSFVTAPGGKGANQALAAARAGAPTRMVGAVGKDSFAAEATELLRAGGVDMGHVRESDASTGIASIFVDERGENVIAIIAGANAVVDPADVAALPVQKGIVLLQHEIPLGTVEAALGWAKTHGLRTILNTAPFRIEAAPLLEQADIVVANETEFDLYAKTLKLAGDDREAQMASFARTTGKTVVLTLGADGVVVMTPDAVVRVDALKIEPVDTVGAGDTFCGYLGAGLLAGLPLEQALRRAAAAGSLACLKPGAQPSIPMADEVTAALRA